MRTIVFLILLCSSTVALAQEKSRLPKDWETTDSVLLGSALTLIAIDWGQTRHIAKNPDRFYESGNKFFLGSHPSVGRVNTYFAGYMLTTLGLAYVLPPNYRRLYLGGLTLYEASLVYHNHSIGIRASF